MVRHQKAQCDINGAVTKRDSRRIAEYHHARQTLGSESPELLRIAVQPYVPNLGGHDAPVVSSACSYVQDALTTKVFEEGLQMLKDAFAAGKALYAIVNYWTGDYLIENSQHEEWPV